MRDKTFSPHRAFTVGEVFNEKAEELPDFIGERGYFSTMFDFSGTLFGRSMGGWYEDLEITPDDYRDCVFRAQKKVGSIGFLSNIIENHDEPRGVSRYIPQGEASPVSKKMLATLYFFLRGLPWIYQGQEIGMENVPLRSIDEVDDISSLDNYQVALRAGTGPEKALKAVERFGRDNARTPFQWTGGENAGFTSGKPWLRINPNYRDINLERQMSDPESVCSYYRKLTALRREMREEKAVVAGIGLGVAFLELSEGNILLRMHRRLSPIVGAPPHIHAGALQVVGQDLMELGHIHRLQDGFDAGLMDEA